MMKTYYALSLRTGAIRARTARTPLSALNSAWPAPRGHHYEHAAVAGEHSPLSVAAVVYLPAETGDQHTRRARGDRWTFVLVDN